MEDMQVTVGADITGFLSKIDAAKAKVGQLTENQGQLKVVINDLNTSLRLNEKELTTAAVNLQKLNKNSSDGKSAAAALREEIVRLSANSNTLSTSLATAKTELANTTTALKLSVTEMKTAEKAGTGLAGGISSVWGGLRKLAYILPGIGIAGLVSLISGPVIEAFSLWFASMNKVSDAAAQLKVNQANLNDVLKDANKDAGKQTADLKILYDAATNVNLSMKDRLAAVKGLQKEFPDFFKNLKTESILNGDSKTAYDNATLSIIANAKARAALSKIEDLSGKILDNEQENFKILQNMRKVDLENTKANLKDSRDAETRGLDQTNALYKKAATQKDLDQNKANAKSLQSQIDFLTKFASLPLLAKAVEDQDKHKDAKPKVAKQAETINDVLVKLQRQLDLISQEELIFKTDKVKEKVSAVESTIHTLVDKFKQTAESPIVLDLEFKIADLKERDDLRKLIFKKPEDAKINIGLSLLPPKPSDLANTLKPLPTIVTKQMAELQKQVSDSLKAINVDALSSLGESIGNAIGGGKDSFKGLFDGIFGSVGDQLKNLGKFLIQSAIEIQIAKSAFKKLLANPVASIAVGVGLIALGAIIKSQVGKVAPGFATGGYINGPGSSTSDSIFARLSRGEYVIKADTVAKFGSSFFDMLNNGFIPQKFATGGSVGSSNIGGGQAIEIYGDFEIKGNRLVAAVQRAQSQISRNG